MAALLTNKRLITAKIEGTYGQDSSPTGSDAMLVKNLDVQPLQADLVSRDLIRPYLGISERLLASKNVQVSFEVEFSGSGIVGLAPAYDGLLQACGFTGAATTTVMTTAAITGTNLVTVGKVAHGFVTGDKIITSGFTDTACNIAAGVVVTRVSDDIFTFPVVGAVNDATADGTPAYRTKYAYTPISTSFKSVTIYFNVDGVLHTAIGCRGTFEISLAVKQIPVYKFTFTGFYAAPSDAGAATPDFSLFKTPYLANTQNTPTFTLFSYSSLLENMTLNMGNQVNYVPLIGAEEVRIVNRAPSGQLLFQAPTISAKDYWSLIATNTLGALALYHGPSNGYKVKVDCPAVSLGNPVYQDSNGVQMLSVPYEATPTSSGNDEVTLTFQ